MQSPTADPRFIPRRRVGVVPAQNRVTPLGEVVAIELRGRWMGNRGCLHEGRTVVRHHRGRRWIICRTEYKGWRAAQWAPGRYTPLFFADEALALAAGHRPCALCRRQAFDAYRAAAGIERAGALDERLQAERWDGRQRRLHQLSWSALPPGTFVLHDDEPALVEADGLRPWSTTGYGARLRRPVSGTATVITPPLSVQVLADGYPVDVTTLAPWT